MTDSLADPQPAQHRRLLIADGPIVDASQDALGHRDVATLLARVLQDWLLESAPLHVALYGPWGGGKSGVVSLLKQQVETTPELRSAVRVVDFSLWRFGADNVRRGLLLFLDSPDGLGTNLGMASRLSTISAKAEVRTRINWRSMVTWLTIAAVLLVVSLVLQIWGGEQAVRTRILGLMAQQAALITAIAAVVKQLVGSVMKTEVSEGSTVPLPDRPDQFRAEFENLLAKAREMGQKATPPWASPQKFVLVLDDLDRVPPSVAWDVLTTIKTFLDAKHCVYVVPCDRDAVVEAMRHASGPSLEARAIDFLDKFFEVSFTLPDTYPRELRRISDTLCKTLGLPPEIAAVAVAGFYRTPRALKLFLNQVSLLREFITVRNTRVGEVDVDTFLIKVVKVHAIRLLWPRCGKAIADMPTLMPLLEQAAQGIAIEGASDVSTYAGKLLSAKAPDEFCQGLREFLRATLGIVVGRDAQSAIKLSEAVWSETRGDLNDLPIYLSTGDKEGVRRLFGSAGVSRAVEVARDAFDAETSTASEETLVGWTGVLLEAFLTDRQEAEGQLVTLALEWLSIPQVIKSLEKLPPEPVVRAVALSNSQQAVTAAERVVALVFADQAIPLSPYTSAILRAVAADRELIATRHHKFGVKLRETLTALIGTSRPQVLARIQVLGQGAPGGDWSLWWDDNFGAGLLGSLSGTSPEDAEIVDYAARAGYQPSDSERRAAVEISSQLLQQSSSPAPDSFSALAVNVLNRVALNGSRPCPFGESDVNIYSAFLKRLGDPEQKLSHLLIGIRLIAGTDVDTQGAFIGDALMPCLSHFARQHVEQVLSVIVDTALTSNQESVAALLSRSTELRDADLFCQVAEKGRQQAATAKAFQSALQAEQAFGDSLAPRVQPLCGDDQFAAVLEKRLADAGSDAASTLHLITMLQSLVQRPLLADGTWHTLAMRLEKAALDPSDLASANAVRNAVRATILQWLPEPDQRHLAEYATAVLQQAQAESNDPPDKAQARIEAALMLQPVCNDGQAGRLANGIAHILARPSLPPTVVSAIVGVLMAKAHVSLVALIGDDGWNAVDLTKKNRTDEGAAFLESLLASRPAPSVEAPKSEPPKAKPGRDNRNAR